MKTSISTPQQLNRYALTYAYKLFTHCPTFISTVELNEIEQLRKKFNISEPQADSLRRAIELKKIRLQEMYIQQNPDFDSNVAALASQCIDENPRLFPQPTPSSITVNGRFPSPKTALQALAAIALIITGCSILVSRNATSAIVQQKDTLTRSQEQQTQLPEGLQEPQKPIVIPPVSPQEISGDSLLEANQLPPTGLAAPLQALDVAAELARLEIDNAHYNELRDWYCVQTRHKAWAQIEQDEKQVVDTELVGRIERLTPDVRQVLKSRYTVADRAALTERIRQLGLAADAFDLEIDSLFISIFGEVELKDANSAASNLWFAMLEQKIRETEQLANPPRQLSAPVVAFASQS